MKTATIPYAMHPDNSRGRMLAQPSDGDMRDIFARDRDRILHCSAFRRLKGKTQVFMSPQDDHHRTRLTHTLEVAQIARTLARTLGINEDLTETIALAHDLGHPPYGHVGEDALQDFTKDYGGYNHNAQSLRIVCTLEQRYPNFDGLNLSWESIEGIIKHNGPFTDPKKIPAYIQTISHTHDIGLHTHATLEAQTAAVADDVAYNNHDIDDGLRSGLVDIDDLCTVAYIRTTVQAIQSQYGDIARHRLMAELNRRLMTDMVTDIVHSTKNTIARIQPKSVQDIRDCGETIVCNSPEMIAKTQQIRDFLFTKVYRSEPIMIMRKKCYENILFLMESYMENLHLVPKIYTHHSTHTLSPAETIQIVTDFVSGMTDNYANACTHALKTLLYKTYKNQNEYFYHI